MRSFLHEHLAGELIDVAAARLGVHRERFERIVGKPLDRHKVDVDVSTATTRSEQAVAAADRAHVSATRDLHALEAEDAGLQAERRRLQDELDGASANIWLASLATKSGTASCAQSASSASPP